MSNPVNKINALKVIIKNGLPMIHEEVYIMTICLSKVTYL